MTPNVSYYSFCNAIGQIIFVQKCADRGRAEKMITENYLIV